LKYILSLGITFHEGPLPCATSACFLTSGP
jgi:hypothetical protein